MSMRVISSVIFVSFLVMSMSVLGVGVLQMDKPLPPAKALKEIPATEDGAIDCSPYINIKDAKKPHQWAATNANCFDGTNFPMDSSTVAGQLSISENFDELYRKDLNRELQRDAFKITWENRKVFRDLYPDIQIQKSEQKAKKCGEELAKCQKDDELCSQDQELKDMLAVEPEKKPFNEKGKDQYYKDHVKAALILSAYLDALNGLKTVKNDEERKALQEKLLVGIDSYSHLFPLLFKSDNYPFERSKNVSVSSVSQFFSMKDFKNPHQLSDLGDLIIRNIDPQKKLSKEYIELFKAGKSDSKNIEEKIFGQPIEVYSGYEMPFGRRTPMPKALAKGEVFKKSVADYLQDKNFMQIVEKQTKASATGYLDFLGQGANNICERKYDAQPIFHHYPELVKRTMSRIEEKYKKEDLEKNKDKALFDYNYTKMKAVYCYTKQKHPVVEAEISDLLLMGALGLGASAGTLAFGGAPAIALAAGGIGLATAGMKDAVVSDKNYVAIASLQQAKTSQLSEYYKASGYNTALAGLDVVLMPLDGIPLAKKAITSIQGNKKLTKVKSLTSSIDNLDPADQMLVAQIYDTIKINIGKADPTMKRLLEETETNKETRELMLLVVDKLKRDMEAKRKVSGVSVQEIQDDLAKKLNSCLARKEGKFPLSDIKSMK